ADHAGLRTLEADQGGDAEAPGAVGQDDLVRVERRPLVAPDLALGEPGLVYPRRFPVDVLALALDRLREPGEVVRVDGVERLGALAADLVVRRCREPPPLRGRV